MTLVSLQSHVDFDEPDADEVMKYSVDPTIFLVFDIERINKLNLFFTQSTVLLDDSPWKMFELFDIVFDIFEYKRYYKYTEPVSESVLNQPLRDRLLARVYFRSENSTNKYTRRTYSLLEYFGDLGGIFEIVWLVIGLMCGKFLERKFNAKLSESLYKVQRYSVDQSEYYNTNDGIQRGELIKVE